MHIAFSCRRFLRTFDQDAVITSQVLGIVLTKRAMVQRRMPTLQGFLTMRSILICQSLFALASAWPSAISLKIRS
jgi:hypothetical protein